MSEIIGRLLFRILLLVTVSLPLHAGWIHTVVDGGIPNSSDRALVFSGKSLWTAYTRGSELVISKWDGSSWTPYVVGGKGEFWGPSMAFGPSGDIHVAYLDRHHHSLLYAHEVGEFWSVENINSTEPVGFSISMVVDEDGIPHIFYTTMEGNLIHTWKEGSVWTSETVNQENGSVSGRISSFIGPDGTIYVAYSGRTLSKIICASYKSGNGWTREAVANEPSSYLSIAVDGEGHVYIGYYNGNHLLFRSKDENGWKNPQLVDGSNKAGDYVSLSLTDGMPCMSYVHGSSLKFACRKEDGTWDIEEVNQEQESFSNYTSLAFDGAGNPNIVCFLSDGRILHFIKTENGWASDVVEDELIGLSGSYNSIAAGPGGSARISYYHWSKGWLKYAFSDGETWETEVVDSTRGNTGYYTSVSVDGSGTPHIGYYNNDQGNVWYAYLEGNAWTFEQVTASTSYCEPVSMALDPSGHPHFACISTGGGWIDKIYYIHKEGGTWRYEAIDDQVSRFDQGYSFIAVGENGCVHMVYPKSDGLYHAYMNQDSTWKEEKITDNGKWKYPCIALEGAHGRPSVAYYDSSNDRLMYAEKGNNGWSFETVASANSSVRYISMSIDTNGIPHISYVYGRQIEYAFKKQDGTWSVSAIDDVSKAEGADVGTVSISLDPMGRPHISYYARERLHHMFLAPDPGDVDGKGDITFYDALRMASYLTGLNTSGYFESYVSDVNGDGSFDIEDALYLLIKIIPQE